MLMTYFGGVYLVFRWTNMAFEIRANAKNLLLFYIHGRKQTAQSADPKCLRLPNMSWALSCSCYLSAIYQLLVLLINILGNYALC